MIRQSTNFGRGSFVGTIMKSPDFFEMEPRAQAQVLGWADGCPVVDELTNPANKVPGRGPDAMLKRYAQVNIWFGYIAGVVREKNPRLHTYLTSKVPRRSDEPVGKHEPQSVPSDYQEYTYPMNTLAGYSLPRILIEQLGKEGDTDRSGRMMRGLDVIEKAAEETQTPLELLAKVSDGLLVAGDVSPEQIFRHTLSRGWVEEHNAAHAIDELKGIMRIQTPGTYHAYYALDPQVKRDLGIV